MSDTGPCYCSECSSSILKRTRAHKSTHWPWGTGLRWVYLTGAKRGLAAGVSWIGVWWSVPTHRHRYLPWTELSTSSTATVNTSATYLAIPQRQCRLCLAPEELLQQMRILLPPSAFCSASWSHLTIHYQDLNFSSTAKYWMWAATPLVPLWVQEPSFTAQLSSSQLMAQRVQAC